ncbi:MAG TPA: hypothetical protein VNA89_12610 [Gemmatimonadaceae bacterium]|nr:hypothetical protein [Gemmatimonadaceae bacterium]
MIRQFVVTLAGVALTAAAAGAQDPRLASRLPDADTRAAVEAVVESARRAGLPTEPLVDKALEGASKRAPSERIVAAVRNLAAHLEVARRALGPESSEAEVIAGASALHAGYTVEALSALRARRGRRPLTVALAVLADLVARGVPRDTATAAVLALTERGVRDAELVAFQSGVERDITQGAPPGESATVRSVIESDAAGGAVGVTQGNTPGSGTNRPTAPKRRP